MSSSAVEVRVTAMRLDGPDVVRCELHPVDERPLQVAQPGAHVDVRLPNGITRPYSVAANEEGGYVIAVRREAGSRGGSAYVCDQLRVGDRLQVGQPRNHFGLVPDASHTVLIAGGIGITPLLPMANALQLAGRDWMLHVVVRDAAALPFARELRAFGDRVRIHLTRSGGRPDLAALLATAPADAHLYCCGPASMLQDFAHATAGRDPARVHVERFEAAAPPPDAGSFTLQLARSGRCVTVGPQQSVLDAVLAAGIAVDHSCLQGICGSCAVRVLDGTPDHRDEVLTDEERAGNASMMICCSRSLSERLVLDL